MDEELKNSEFSENTENTGEAAVSNDASAESVSELKAEIERLRGELEESKKQVTRVSEDISEFHRLFPNTELSDLPEEVKESVRSGASLSASYALYEKRIEAERARAGEINRQNALRAFGAAGKNTGKEYFTPDEVREMSQTEVRENYRQIVESMKKWNR